MCIEMASSRRTSAVATAVTNGYVATIGATRDTGAMLNAPYISSTAPPFSTPVMANQTNPRLLIRGRAERLIWLTPITVAAETE